MSPRVSDPLWLPTFTAATATTTTSSSSRGVNTCSAYSGLQREQQQQMPDEAPTAAAAPKQESYLATISDSLPLNDFFRNVPGCAVIERLVGRELVFFTAPALTPEQRRALAAKPREYKPDPRHSQVLMLTISGCPGLALKEAVHIVKTSPLWASRHLIDLVAVNPKTMSCSTVSDPSPGRTCISHIYVQFSSVEAAMQHRNTVDAQPYERWFIHSPQCDMHSVFFTNPQYKRDSYIWDNPLSDSARKKKEQQGERKPARQARRRKKKKNQQQQQLQQQQSKQQQDNQNHEPPLLPPAGAEETCIDFTTEYDWSQLLTMFS